MTRDPMKVLEGLMDEKGQTWLVRAVKILTKQRGYRMMEKRQFISKQWVKEAWAKQDGRCARCRAEKPLSEMTGDHFVPLALGGAHKQSNIRAVCGKCNSEKSDADPVKDSKRTGNTIISQVPRP